MKRREDTSFMSEYQAAVKRRPRLSANLLLLSIIGFISWSVWWADQAVIDEATMGLGRVVPSSKVQVIQNLEGGIISEIRVAAGDRIEKNHILLVIDDTQFRSKVREDHAKQQALQAMVSRLNAESNRREFISSNDFVNRYDEFVGREQRLYRARREELESAIRVIEKQRAQREQEIVELEGRIRDLESGIHLARKELKITRSILAASAISEVDLIRVQREVADRESELHSAQKTLPRLRLSLSEYDQQIEEKKAAFRSRALEELRKAQGELQILEESMTPSRDRLQRTEVRSPVDGTVKRVLVTTVGGVVKPGMDLVEIVPTEDTLLIEAKIKPADVAFLHPGQPAAVRVTAYDYAVYGLLKAKLENISADSIVDENRQSFFEVQVRTEKNYLEKSGTRLPIIPGMTVEVDIMTGKRTLMDYLLKPILRARYAALKER